jgi:hypothetical protein
MKGHDGKARTLAVSMGRDANERLRVILLKKSVAATDRSRDRLRDRYAGDFSSLSAGGRNATAEIRRAIGPANRFNRIDS